MCAPRAQGAVVHFSRVLDRLRARVVGKVVGELRALGAGDEVEHQIVICKHALLGAAIKAGDDLREFLIRHIGLVVHQRAVVEDQNVLLGHELRRVERELFLVDLVGNDKILKREHRHTAAERLDAKAGDQLRRRFGDRDDAPAVLLLKFLQNAADKRGFARRGTAREDDLRNVLGHKSHFLSAEKIVAELRDGLEAEAAVPAHESFDLGNVVRPERGGKGDVRCARHVVSGL